MWERLANEPTAILGLVRAGVVLGSAFGLNLSVAQTVAIYGFTEAVTSVLNRLLVTPTRKVD
jgi:hypothetical protein